jgi:hypothetical protein
MHHFDKMWQDIHTKMLNDARTTNEGLSIALALLTTKDGQERIACSDLEYGDEEALTRMREFVDDATPQLKKGESIRLVLLDLPIDTLHRLIAQHDASAITHELQTARDDQE